MLTGKGISGARFTLERGRWYGLTMFPGYRDAPYHSPIRVDRIVPLGGRQFELQFLNRAYAEGVQNFTTKLRTLRRVKSHIVAEIVGHQDRTYVIVALTTSWFDVHYPNVDAKNCFDSEGNFDVGAIKDR